MLPPRLSGGETVIAKLFANKAWSFHNVQEVQMANLWKVREVLGY